jgi:microsomal epoxide hydrolase
MADYSTLPQGATLKPKPFKAHVPEEKLQLLKDLVKISPIAAPTFENTNAGRHFGMKREWLADAKEEWSTKFDWRKQEDRINASPNFTVLVKDDAGIEIDVHFLALFSKKKDAIPIAFYHGWPGSILEFLDLLELLKKKYPSPEELPYHVIVPSLPGYAFSSGPPLDQDYSIAQAAMCLDKLMRGLGFNKYLAQGGDLGSFVSRIQASTSDACVGMHLNMVAMGAPENKDKLEINEAEAKAMPRGKEFMETGGAYAVEHGTRTATIGLALAASPIALLSWYVARDTFGELSPFNTMLGSERSSSSGPTKIPLSRYDGPYVGFRNPRTDTLQEILTSVSLYYLTDTFPRCIYPYRGVSSANPKNNTIRYHDVTDTNRWAGSKDLPRRARAV